MSTTFSKISVGISGNFRLNFRDRLDENVCFCDEIIKTPTRYGIAARIDDNSGFNKINSAYAPVCRVCDRSRTERRLWFITKDGNDRRRVDNHFGSPRSS